MLKKKERGTTVLKQKTKGKDAISYLLLIALAI